MKRRAVTLYKLTDEHGQTRNRTQWGSGITHKATGDAEQLLCTDGWIHAYTHPLLAALFNPIGPQFTNPRLWEAKGIIGKSEPSEVGCLQLTTLREIPLPEITVTQRVAFGILATKQVYQDKEWNIWADNWLSGEDRSAGAAYAANAYAATAYASFAAYAARAAAYFPNVPVFAIYPAAYAAIYATAYSRGALNLIGIAKGAMKYN